MTVNHKLVKFHNPLYLLSYKCAILKYTIYKPLLRHSTWLHTGNVNNNERPSNLSDSDLSLHININPFLRDRIRIIGTSATHSEAEFQSNCVRVRLPLDIVPASSSRHREQLRRSSSLCWELSFWSRLIIHASVCQQCFYFTKMHFGDGRWSEKRTANEKE